MVTARFAHSQRLGETPLHKQALPVHLDPWHRPRTHPRRYRRKRRPHPYNQSAVLGRHFPLRLSAGHPSSKQRDKAQGAEVASGARPSSASSKQRRAQVSAQDQVTEVQKQAAPPAPGPAGRPRSKHPRRQVQQGTQVASSTNGARPSRTPK